mgnify:CR=1 FL=1
MSKSKINAEELFKDIDDVLKLIDEIEVNKLNNKKMLSKAKKLKNIFESKYSKDLDIKK